MSRELRARALAGRLLLVAAALAPAGLRAQTPSDSIEVASVAFVGAESFTDLQLQSAILTAATSCGAVAPICWFGIGINRQFFDEITAERDVLRLRLFYAQRGYRSARVTLETQEHEDGVRVTFHIEEGDPVVTADLTVRNAEGVPPEVIRNLPLRQGEPFDLLLLEASRDTLRLRMQNRGYAQAEVLTGYDIPSDSLAAHVYLDLFPGPHSRFGDITVVGAEQVTPATVRKMLTFETGDVYSREELLRSQRNLFAQELFRHVEIRTAPQPDAPDSIVAVEVRLNEGNVHRVRAGLGVSSAEYLLAEGRWISRSFMGGARRLELRAQLSNILAGQLAPAPFFENIDPFYGDVSGQLAADFTQPWFFDALNTLNAGVFLERRSIPGVFVRSALGGSIGFGRLLGNNATLDIGYRPELSKLQSAEGNLVFCVNFTACDEEQIEAIAGLNLLAPLTAGFVWDRSNSLFAPNRGWVIRLNGEYAEAITGSDFQYARIAGDFIDYSAITPGVIIATRFSPGVAVPLRPEADAEFGVHLTRRFYAGGPNSVRGYSQFRLGPKALTIEARRLIRPVEENGAGCTPQAVNTGSCDAATLAAVQPDAFTVQPLGGNASFEGSVELRFPLFRDLLRGVVFFDYGQVWRDHDDMSLRSMVWAPGGGIRYFSPIGPIRIDIGYNPMGAERVRVFTTQLEYCPDGAGTETCEPLEDGVEYDPADLFDTRVIQAQNDVMWNPRDSFFRRLQFHFSIGQAF